MKFKTITVFFACNIILISASQAQSWSKITTTGNVPALKNHSAVYDRARYRMLVFGGRMSSGTPGNELWSLDLDYNVWTKITPTGNSPSARYTQNAYFDTVNNRMIIWAGQGTELYNDVWAYKVATNSWVQLWADGNVSGAPLKRYGTGSVFDPVTKNIYTFAGFTTSGRFEDTWTFQTDSIRWTDRTNNPHPPKRCLHSACFAFDQRKMIIYGGQDTGPLDDIWSLSLNNFTWQNLTPSFKPPGRFFYSIIYTGNGNIVMFGGLDSIARGDMWKFSLTNNSWETVNQSGNIPAARWGQSAIYIPEGDRMVMFGGEGASNFNDTWQFTGASVIGIEPINHNAPDKFSLDQNYPNPFNPSTVISFQIPVNNFTAIKIYNSLGKEIRTLLNKQLQAGSYKIDFDGSSLPSGVYFYKLIAGNFSETKKMILLK